MSNGKDKKKSNSPKPNDPTGQRMYFEWTSEEGGEEDVFAKRDKYRKSFWKTSPNVKVRNKGLAGAEVTKKGGAYAYYRKNSKAAQEWNKAFAAAKAAGKKTFTWDGRLYTTETAEKPEKKKPRSMKKGGEEDVFAKRDKYRKSFWKTSPNVKVRNKGLAGAEVTKKGGAYAYYRKKSKAAQLFRKAFADAKAAGKKTFTWDGRLYTTETAEKPEKKKPRSMKKGGTVKETGIYKLHKGEKVVPVKKKKKTEPKLRPQPEWEVSDFQWVPDPDKLGALKLRYTESGVKKKRKIATHKAKTEGKKGFPYRPTHKIEKEKNP